MIFHKDNFNPKTIKKSNKITEKKESFFVAFDTETTGAYPGQWEICEIAGVKWRDGKIIDEFSQLIRPRGSMHPVAQQIHGISAQQLNREAFAEEVLPEFLTFAEDAVLVAHHAPFDMGFLSCDLEKYGLHLPSNKVACTSLLSQSLFPDSPNHKLQTLMDYLQLKKQHPRHRALSDAKACLLLALRCFEKICPLTMDQINLCMKVSLDWGYFSMKAFKKTNPEIKTLMEAIEDQQKISMVYHRGSKPGVSRKILPLGLVRNPTGDFLVAEDSPASRPKRFYLDFVSHIRRDR